MNLRILKATWHQLVDQIRQHASPRQSQHVRPAHHNGLHAAMPLQDLRQLGDELQPELVGELCAFCGSDEPFCGAEQREN